MLRKIVPAAALVLYGSCAGCTTQKPEWTTARAEPFALSVEYPPALFPNGFLSRASHNAEWIFGPYQGGTSLLLQASTIDSDETPYRAACATNCSGETYHRDEPSLGISAGHIGDKIFFSKCLRAGQEMHCLHVIYPAAESATYAEAVEHLSESLR